VDSDPKSPVAERVETGFQVVIQALNQWLESCATNLPTMSGPPSSPMLPNKPRGVPRVNDRRVLNGIFWVLRSGAPWRDLPQSFGPTPPATTVSFAGGGLASGAVNALATTHDASVQTIDTSIVRVHQHAACITQNRSPWDGHEAG
jgi:transposase